MLKNCTNLYGIKPRKIKARLNIVIEINPSVYDRGGKILVP